MLGLLLIYFIGKEHYRLASEYDRSGWGFAILGIAVYYAGTFLFGIMFGVFVEAWRPGYVGEMPSLLLGVIALPFGLLATYLLHYFLKRSWAAQRLDAERHMKMDHPGQPPHGDGRGLL